MKLHKMKKKIALWLALVMLFGVVAPIGTVEVYANPSVDARGRLLRFDTNALLRNGLERRSVSHFGSTTTDASSILLEWDVPVSQNKTGLYVLRYFTTGGNKVELWVEHSDNSIVSPTLSVMYHVFVRNPGINVYNEIRPHISGDPFVPNTGEWFNCPVTNDTIRFFWMDNIMGSRFMVYLENIELGQVHGFTLEFYDEVEAAIYSTLDATGRPNHPMHRQLWQPNASRPVGWPQYTPNESDRIFLFPGFTSDDIDVIPFAEDMDNMPHTVGPGRIPLLAPMYTPPPPSSLNAQFQNVTSPPVFTTHALDLVDPAVNELPANGNNGMDIRVALPRFFNEATGRFDTDFFEGVDQNITSPNFSGFTVNMSIRMGSTPHAAGSEGFIVDILDLRNSLAPWDGTDNGGVSGTTLLPVRPGRNLLDASILEAVPTATSPGAVSPGALSVVRVKVGGLQPSLVYDEMQIILNSGDSNVFFDRASTFDHIVDLHLNTLLEYRLQDPAIAGMVSMIVTPFRRHLLLGGQRNYVEGRYLLDNRATDLVPPGTLPVEVHFNGLSGEVRIPIPFVDPTDERTYRYRIDFIEAGFPRDADEMVRIPSQTVIVNPIDRPTIGTPNTFQIIRQEYRPLRSFMGSPGQQQGTEAALGFQARWQLGSISQIHRLFQKTNAQLVPLPGEFYDQVTVTYRMYRNIAPSLTVPPPEPYADIHVILTAVTTSSPAAIVLESIRVAYEIDMLDGNGNIIGSVAPGVPAFLQREGDFYIAVVNFADLTAFHNNRTVAGNPFRFPSVNHMFVEPKYVTITPETGPSRVEPLPGWPRSPFASLTLDDFSNVSPPPPVNLTVDARQREEQPTLDVQFTVPTQALASYVALQYDFNPLVRFNLYISAFESVINNVKDSEHNLRDSFPASDEISFLDSIERKNIGGTPLNVIDLSDIRNTLVQENKVVRITDIPLISPFAYPFTVNGVDIDAWDRDVEALAASVNVLLANILDDRFRVPDPFAIGFTLTGLDENQRYFLFADLVVEQFVTERSDRSFFPPQESEGDPIRAYPGIFPGAPIYSRSVPTELVGDITIGTPQIPGPGEIEPSAPTGLDHVRPVGQTEATLFWNAIASEDPSLVAIEFEIVRVTDNRMNINAMVDSQGHPLPLSNIVNSRQDAVGWQTNQNFQDFVNETPPPTAPFLRVYGGETPRIPINDANQLYAFDNHAFDTSPPPQVSFTDRSLRPNNLYFYYVRTIRRVLFTDSTGQEHILENRSSWVEESITTSVVQRPEDLRIEDGLTRSGFDPQSQQFVSWTHPATQRIIDERGEGLTFQYQVRIDNETWQEINTVSVNHLINPGNFTGGRFFYMVRGLESGTIYQMRVRVIDRETGDISIWSNVITFMTDWDDTRFQLEREAGNWLEHLRRLLLEQTRNPYWVASDTSELFRVVYRPDAFRAMIDGTPGTAIPLFNTGARTSVYYLPISGILEANDYRKGFSVSYEDMDLLFAPRFLNQDHNRAIVDMARNVSNRNVNVNDYFVRLTLHRRPVVGTLHGNPPLGDAVDVQIDLVGVNTNTRNIRTWDTVITNRILQEIDNRASDPIIRQNVINLIERGEHDNERAQYIMLDYLATIEAAVKTEINRQVTRDVPVAPNSVGIIAPQIIPITAFDAPVHIVSTRNEANISVTAFSQVRWGNAVEWNVMPTAEHTNGVALVTQAPGVYAFSGRAVNIHGIENVPNGAAITALIVRFGLVDDFESTDFDLYSSASRHFVVGSVARIAGAPASADPMHWVASNMNVVLANRNVAGLVSQQEAIALVMALYERRTNTRVSSIIIRNHANTAGMTLDNRYAQAVRAAFELGIVTDSDLRPGNPVTIGDFMDMLVVLDGRIGL